jgi:cation-transporting P-type ATPase E
MNNATPAIQGLTSQQAQERRARGLGHKTPARSSRSYAEIFRENVFTFINNVLFILGIVLVMMGKVSDAVITVGIILINVVVSVIQEMRAKRTLDRIALLNRPTAMVVRDGEERSIDPDEIVVGDVLLVSVGDQIVVDGAILKGNMEADESLLTGESDLIDKKEGNPVYSGSFCVSGSAYYEAQKVGEQSLAHQITTGARAYRRVLTPLQQQINLVLRVLLLVAVYLEILLAIRSFLDKIPLVESVKMSVVIIGLVPNGLFLAISVAYAMGAVRIAGKGALVQQANAVESLSNVDVLCLDKTGTLTANRICFEAVAPLIISESEFKQRLGDFAASLGTGNPTSEAIRIALPGNKLPVADEVAFSSERKWSALAFDIPKWHGSYVLGSPEVLHSALTDAADTSSPLGRDLETQVQAWAEKGLRVLLLAQRPDSLVLHDKSGQPILPEGLIPLGLVCLSDQLRPEARQTLEAFQKAGVKLKIISGDNPVTVAALARQAGLSKDARLISGLDLAKMDSSQFTAAAEAYTVFGRITPQQKEHLVQVLRARGHYVAMIGDGVNDVLSLKQANLGIAMQSGSQAARAVADIILMKDSFGALPHAMLEGQRIIIGMQDILKLFLTRVLYVTLLILSIGTLDGFPFEPKNISILTLLTVGIPTIFLAAWARPAVVRRVNLTRRLIHFILPAGIAVGLFGLFVFLFHFIPAFQSTHNPEAAALGIPQTATTAFTILCGLMLIIFVEPPIKYLAGGDRLSGDWRPTILAIFSMALYLIVLLTPGLRRFFELAPLSWWDYILIGGSAMVWAILLRWIWRRRVLERFLDTDFGTRL